jgi:hypothetical protein
VALQNILSLYNGHLGSKLGGIEKIFFTLQRTKFLKLGGMDRKIIPSPYNGHFRCVLSHGFAKIHRKFLFKKEPFILQRTFFCRL